MLLIEGEICGVNNFLLVLSLLFCVCTYIFFDEMILQKPSSSMKRKVYEDML